MGSLRLLVTGLPLAALLAASCAGGAGEPGGEAAAVVTVLQTAGRDDAPPGSVAALLDGNPAEDVALVFGSSDFAELVSERVAGGRG